MVTTSFIALFYGSIVIFILSIFVVHNSKEKDFKNSINWMLIDFSGLRLIWAKIRPPINIEPTKRKPATFTIWVIGIYIALFGITSQRYENRIDIIENRASAILDQLSSSANKKSISRIPSVQRILCPYKPEFLKPHSIFLSLFKKCNHYETRVLLRETIEDWKKSLKSVSLYKAYLQEANLQNANMSKANLQKVNFKKANLRSAKLDEADIRGADFEGAVLIETDLRSSSWDKHLKLISIKEKDFLPAKEFKRKFQNGMRVFEPIPFLINFKDAILMKANFQRANLSSADFSGADLRGSNMVGAFLYNTKFHGANLQDANLLDTKIEIEQLSKAKTLYNAKLEPGLMNKVRKKYPHLLSEPENSTWSVPEEDETFYINIEGKVILMSKEPSYIEQ